MTHQSRVKWSSALQPTHWARRIGAYPKTFVLGLVKLSNGPANAVSSL